MESLRYVGCFSINLGTFLLLIFGIFPLLLSLLSSGTLFQCNWCICWCPTFIWGSVHFFFLFTEFFGLHKLCWSVFKFANSFFCQLRFTVAPSNDFVNFSYCTAQLQNFQLLLFLNIIYVSLLLFFIWCDIVMTSSFTSLIMLSSSSVNIFRIAVVQSFSAKSDIWSSKSGLCCLLFSFFSVATLGSSLPPLELIVVIGLLIF